MASDAKRSRWVAKMSLILVSRSLLADSQEAHRNLVTGNTCPIRVSKSLSKLHFSAQERPLTALGRRVLVALRRVAAVWSEERRSGRWRSAVAGRTCPCPLPRRLPANIIITITITMILLIIIINCSYSSVTRPDVKTRANQATKHFSGADVRFCLVLFFIERIQNFVFRLFQSFYGK